MTESRANETAGPLDVVYPVIDKESRNKKNVFTRGVSLLDVDLANHALVEFTAGTGLKDADEEDLLGELEESHNFRRAYLDFVANGGSQNNNAEALLRLCMRMYLAGCGTCRSVNGE